MKKIRICGLFPIFLVALLAVASCETDKPDFSSAEVSIELVSVTETTAEFKLSLLNAETAYWMISTESDKHPDARSIKDGGTEYDAEAGYAAVENLVPGSQYIFWAVAEKDNVLGDNGNGRVLWQYIQFQCGQLLLHVVGLQVQRFKCCH